VPKKQSTQQIGDALKKRALGYPDATEHRPWGEVAIKVKGKVFLFLHADKERVSLSTKLPKSRWSALVFPFAEPTGYGLGKSGWVSAKFEGAGAPPLELLYEWIDESYRAVAPKTLVATLDAPPPAKRATAAKKKVKRARKS
jgi:predicted DNA-binding protein (MmcQ/YjbR family)